MHLTRFLAGAGALLILAGLFGSSAFWAELLRGTPDASSDPALLAGASLFRISLGVLGAFALLVAFKPLPSPARDPVSLPPRQAYRLGIVALLSGAVAVRLYNLGSGLWLDEILTFVNYARLPFRAIVTTYANENQHFLYSLMAHACFLLFGENAWALRIPAVLFGVGSIWALYQLGRLVSSEREGLLAAALLAFSYHHVWFSQNARGYTGLLFWTLLSTILLLRGLRENTPRIWVWYALTACLGIYTHITMVFVISGQFFAYCWTLYRRRGETWIGRWNGLIGGFCLGGLLTFQLHSIVLPQVFSGMAKTVSVVDAWKRPLWTLLEIGGGMLTNFGAGATALGVIVMAGALAVSGAGLLSFARRNPALVQVAVIPPLAGAAAVMWVGHHLWPRFFFFAFGFGALIVVRGAMALQDLAERRPGLRFIGTWKLGTVLPVCLILASAASVPMAFGPKQDYAGAMEFVHASTHPGDAVVTAGLASFTYKTLYQLDWEPVETARDLDLIRLRSRRTFVVYTLPPVLESMYPDIMAAIRRDFRVVKQFRGTLQGGTVYVGIHENRS